MRLHDLGIEACAPYEENDDPVEAWTESLVSEQASYAAAQLEQLRDAPRTQESIWSLSVGGWPGGYVPNNHFSLDKGAIRLSTATTTSRG